MRIKNCTAYSPEPLLKRVTKGFNTYGLTLEIKYSRSKQKWTGTHYGKRKLIRVRINPNLTYPCWEGFATGVYTNRWQDSNMQYWTQKLQRVEFYSPEELVTAGFLHEFSHYLDHQAGRSSRWKQTKADKFALEMLTKYRMGRFLPVR